MARVAIVGAGLGGLSCASHLIAKGHEVSIFERESSPGGRARRITSPSSRGEYLTEIGPTVFTMLDTAQLPFGALEENLATHVDMLQIDPSYRGVFADGSKLNWSSDPAKRQSIIADFSGEKDAEGFENYVQWLEELVRVEYDNFVAKNFSHNTDLLKTPGALLKLLSMGAFTKMDSKVSQFISDPRLISMSTFQALYAGVTPAQALAVYCIISYMDLVQGVYYPKGGMCAYGEALADVLSDAGAKISYNAQVTKVETLNNGKHVIHCGSDAETFDAVVSNADLAYSYPEIFEEKMPTKLERGQYSPSCLIYVVGGVASKEKDRAHHTIHFSKDDTKSYVELVDDKKMMTNPSFLVSNPNVTDPGIVPAGSDVFYVLEPCPHLDSGVKFEEQRQYHQDRMRGHIAKSGIVMDSIDCEIFVDPIDWEKERMYRGTPFSMAHTFFQSGPFRPSNQLKKRPGLFFCGTGTTPGVGIPMVIESGRLAAQVANEYLEGKK